MRQYDEFEKQYQFETKQLVNYVYKALAEGKSVVVVKQDLIYKGIPEQDAEYVVNYIYRKKRWQIAWERAGGGARLVVIGLGNILVAAIIFAAGYFAAGILGTLFSEYSVWLANGLMVVAIIFFATGTLSTLWGVFRLLTAGEDSMRGCLVAALAVVGVAVLGLVTYWLITLF